MSKFCEEANFDSRNLLFRLLNHKPIVAPNGHCYSYLHTVPVVTIPPLDLALIRFRSRATSTHSEFESDFFFGISRRCVESSRVS